jgi:Xaa-Pro aminopeptidase
MTEARRSEHQSKLERLLAWLDATGRDAVLIRSRHNFAWLTAGGRHGVDLGREDGAGALLVRRDGRRFILSSNIEESRLANEEVAALGYESIAWPWQDERASPSLMLTTARALLMGDGDLVTDVAAGPVTNVDAELMRLRASLLPDEITRYRALGRDAGEIVGEVCRGLTPGQPERAIAARVAARLGERDIRTPVLLVAADERIGRYRHPVPTARPWMHVVMVVVCAERHGLIASLTRLVCAGPPDDDLRARTQAATAVFFRLAEATRAGATGRELYDVATRGYADEGFEGEERLHHQGGACGYRTRDWVAHPSSGEIVCESQAFAWNPSITGTKVEETFLLAPDGPMVITGSPDWPAQESRCQGTILCAPLVLAL